MIRGDARRDAAHEAVDRMSAGIVHRGPDDSGTFLKGPCILAARRLSVIDVEHGHQPMASADERYALAFNGEIYNAPALREELQQRGHTFRTRCDTEVLLAACIEWGDAAAERLNGMFAFAFYDAEQARLLLVRDRMGIKPLYVVEREGDLYFASELDALLRAGVVSGAIDAASLDAYFTYLYVPGPETIFQEVTQVNPGEQFVWQAGRATRRSYWRPEYTVDDAWSLDTAAEEYMDLLCDSVRLQRVSDVPLGAFLSGGMDSASVVAALAEAGPVETFTIGFRDPAADERAYAEAVADRFGTRHTSEVMEPDLVDLLPRLVPHFGQPFADSSAVPTYLVSKLARESVTVALSGDGGDELFAGYTWLHMTYRARAGRRVPAPLRRLAGTVAAMGETSPVMGKIQRFVHDTFASEIEVFRRRQTCFGAEERARLYNMGPTRAIQRAARDRFQGHWDEAEGISDDDRMLRQDLRMYLPDDVLTKVDRMSMAASLEVRVPLLDHRIVEFASTLPFALKYDGGVSKRVAKHAFRNILPEVVLKQRKRGFSIPVDQWFRGPLRAYFKEAVLATDSEVRAWLDPLEIGRLWEAHQTGRRNYGHRLWCLLAFELWLRYVAGYVEIGVD